MKTSGKLQATIIAAVFTAILFAFSSTSGNYKSKSTSLAEAFSGSVTYEVSATGTDEDVLKMFKTYSPEKFEVVFAENKFAMVETGGMTKANIVVIKDKKSAHNLDFANRTATELNYVDMDASAKTVKDMMPYHFKPELEKTTETQKICGYNCTKYKVLRSGFVKKDAVAHIWLTEEIHFPLSRFDLQSGYTRIITPLPLALGEIPGSILRMDISESQTDITYLATKVTPGNAYEEAFQFPDDFTIIPKEK